MVATASASRECSTTSPRRSKRGLSCSEEALLKLMQSVNFGRLESLIISDGKPFLSSPPRIVREHKFGGENGPRSELAADDFLLKQQVIELFGYFDELQDGVIDVLEIKHGLPFRMIVTEVPA